MKSLDNNLQAFFALVRAGLWGKEVRLSAYETVDFNEVYRIAQEQSTIGIVAAGLEQLTDVKMPQNIALTLAGEILQLEQRNRAMNAYIAELVEKLRRADIYTLLVKGQGIAQCYEKPLWRSCGDVDLYLSKDNYEKAKALLTPLATSVEKEEKKRLHLGMTIDGWVVELHGTMHTKLSGRMNRVADEVHRDIFFNGNVRSWNANGVQVFLPSANNDVIIVFNHIINHFFLEGVGLRQICDWCRLLWTYRGELDVTLLEKRIRRMGLMTEWKAFYNLANRYLGMPDELQVLGSKFQVPSAMFQVDARFDRRADRIMAFVLESGNFGHNRDVSYRTMKSAAAVNAITLWRRLRDFARLALLFPVDSPRFFGRYLVGRMVSKVEC